MIGAAVLGTVGTGIYGGFREAIDNMVHIEERREPIPENVAVYKKQYKVYNKLVSQETGNILDAIS